MKLEDQFSYLVRRHTDPTGFHPLPKRVKKSKPSLDSCRQFPVDVAVLPRRVRRTLAD
jgi:hypothetical protein